MSGNRRHSPAVYRRRRLVAILLLLVLVGGIAWGVWALTRPGDDTAPEPTATTSTEENTPVPEGDAVDQGDSEEEEPGVPTCAPNELTLLAKTDKQEYQAGESPQLSLELTNTSDTDCILNVGTSVQQFTVSSGSDTWWRSTDCQGETADAVVTMEAGQVLASETPLAWDRTRSSADTCDTEDRPQAPSGGASYHLTVKLGDLEAEEPVQFMLY